MKIWLITIGEPIPALDPDARALRTSILKDELIARGHQVTWVTSRFNHARKRRFDVSSEIEEHDGVRYVFLSGMDYSKNISITRMINHSQIAHHFRKISRSLDVPDIILCSFPSIELCREAVIYAKCKDIPVVTDVRDLWPDIFVDVAPPGFRFIAKLLLYKYFLDTRYVFRNSFGITGVSKKYVEWGCDKSGRPVNPVTDIVFPIGYKGKLERLADTENIDSHLKSLGVDAKKKIVWFIGVFGSTYDLDTVLHAASQLIGRHDLLFVLSGEGDNYERLIKKSNDLDCSNVIFTGWLNQHQINAVSSVADVGLLAYRDSAPQSLPNKLFEYMSMGIPLLSSLQTECKNLIEETDVGENYEPGDPNSLVKKLELLLSRDTPLFRENILKTFNSRFLAEKIYSEYSDYLESVQNSVMDNSVCSKAY